MCIISQQFSRTNNGIKFELLCHINIMTLMLRFNRLLRLVCSSLLLCAWSLQAAPNYTEYARLLKTYVESDGVRYKDWAEKSADIRALREVVSELGQSNVDALSKAEQKALYINLYNASMLQAVLDNYPLKSVKEIGFLPFSIFKKNFIPLGDAEVSLDDVEQGILLKQYFDPRIHFAINCASESCPPLRAEPFVGKRLDAQLDEQTRLFAGSDRAARVNAKRGAIVYSELFKWYADDFAVKNPATFLNRYRTSMLSENAVVAWIDYDWSLNAAKNYLCRTLFHATRTGYTRNGPQAVSKKGRASMTMAPLI